MNPSPKKGTGGPMDHVCHTPIKNRTGAMGGAAASGELTAAAVASPLRRLALSAGTASSPSVRRRPPSPTTAAQVKAEPASPPPSPPPPPPSDVTVKRVMHLQESVGCVVNRHLQRPLVYAVPQLTAARPPTGERGTIKSRLCSDFWSQVGGRGGRGRGGGGAPPKRPLTEENRSMLLFAVTSLETRLSSNTYLSSDVLSFLLRHCTEGDAEVRRRCLQLLQRVAFLHPPHGRQMRNLYRPVLAGPESDWQPLWAAVERCVSPAGDSTPAQEDHLLDTELLDLLVGLLEEDISFWWRNSKRLRAVTEGPLSARPLLIRALWRPDQQPGTSVAARRLLCRWLVQTHGRPADGGNMTTRRLLLRLVAMAAELTRMTGQTNFLEVTEDMQTLAGELSRAVEETKLSSAALDELLSALRPAWLTARLAVGQLHLRHERERLTRPLTLELIHTHYLAEKENRLPPPPPPHGTPMAGSSGVNVAGSYGVNVGGSSGANGALVAAKRSLHFPDSGAVKRRRLNGRRIEEEGVSVPRAAGSEPEPDDTREYTLLLYHLLCAHLLHTGLTEVRLQMTGHLLREAVGAARPAPPPAPVSAADLQQQRQYVVHYRRELEWIQDRLWRRGGAGRLHVRFELYMHTITKL